MGFCFCVKTVQRSSINYGFFTLRVLEQFSLDDEPANRALKYIIYQVRIFFIGQKCLGKLTIISL